MIVLPTAKNQVSVRMYTVLLGTDISSTTGPAASPSINLLCAASSGGLGVAGHLEDRSGAAGGCPEGVRDV